MTDSAPLRLKLARILGIAALALSATLTHAQSGGGGGVTSEIPGSCNDAEIFSAKIFTQVCWSCMLPIRVFWATFGDKSEIPSESPAHDSVCVCEDALGVPSKVGFPSGMYQAASIVETVRLPYCSPALGGVRLTDGYMPLGGRNSQINSADAEGKSFFSAHMFSFPLNELLELVSSANCSPNSYRDFDLLWPSELDPCWNDPELALFCAPDSLMFANPVAQSAAFIDCPAASLGKPLDDLYWIAGCWGSIMPMAGHTTAGNHPVRDSSLVTTKLLSASHRRGFIRKTIGEEAMCNGGIYSPHIPKSQYKYQMFYPVAQANSPGFPGISEGQSDADGGGSAPADSGSDGGGGGLLGGFFGGGGGGDSSGGEGSAPTTWEESGDCCNRIGASTFTWGEHRSRPVKEDHLYIIWQWSDCCNTLDVANF